MSSDPKDRELIQALEDHRPVGEQYARTGEVPVSTAERRPTMRPPAGSDQDATPAHAAGATRAADSVVGCCALGVIVVALVAYGLFSYCRSWSTGRTDEARPVDAIVVMGAAQYDGRPSPQLAARLDHVVELWHQALAPLVIVTGGKQPGDRFTEADASAAYLVDRGVPADAIVQEDTVPRPYDSLARCRDSVGDAVESVLLVTDPYHSLRIRLIADELGLDAYVSPTRPRPCRVRGRSDAGAGRPPASRSGGSSASTVCVR